MKDKSKIVLMTQARLSSQRIPQKMILPFGPDDKSLFRICLEKLELIKDMTGYNTYVSIREEELLEDTKFEKQEIQTKIFRRSEQSAVADTGLTSIYEWYQRFLDEGYEYVIMVNACMPFLKTDTIVNFFDVFAESSDEGMFGVISKKDYFWGPHGLLNEWPVGQDLMNTKAVAPTCQAAHALYASRIDAIPQGYWMARMPEEMPKLFPLPEYECLDIDEQWQFDMCKRLYNK